MRRRIKSQTAVLLALFGTAGYAFAAEKVGKVCVQAISKGENWRGNDTGANESSRFSVQIDKLPPFVISTNSSGVFTNLSLQGKHVVKIRLADKPLTSFRFSFEDEHSDHLRLWYNPFYGTWSLWSVPPGKKCACPTKPS